VAEEAPSALRGTALGFFHLAIGAVQLATAAAAGWAWERMGAPAVFAGGCACALVALGGLSARRPGVSAA
jgi:hypothetical protein